MSVNEAVDRAFKKGGVCLDRNDLVFMVMNAFMNPSSLPEYYEERVQIFLEILSKNEHVFLNGRAGRSLYFKRKMEYPNDLQERVGVIWCFTELFYLYRQYLDAERTENYKDAKNYLPELIELEVDVDLLVGRGRPNQIALHGLATILKDIFSEFDFRNMQMSAKFKIATNRMNDSEGKVVMINAKRMAMLTASVFCVHFSDRIYEVDWGDVELSAAYVHPYFHQLMHIKNSLS